MWLHWTVLNVQLQMWHVAALEILGYFVTWTGSVRRAGRICSGEQWGNDGEARMEKTAERGASRLY